MRSQYMQSAANYTYLEQGLYGNHSCGMPRDDSFHIFRDIDSDYPWTGLVGGLTILALNAWCTDQVRTVPVLGCKKQSATSLCKDADNKIARLPHFLFQICVQRSLSAKSISHAKAGLLLAAYLKILPFFFYLMPGMISRIYFPGTTLTNSNASHRIKPVLNERKDLDSCRALLSCRRGGLCRPGRVSGGLRESERLFGHRLPAAGHQGPARRFVHKAFEQPQVNSKSPV